MRVVGCPRVPEKDSTRTLRDVPRLHISENVLGVVGRSAPVSLDIPRTPPAAMRQSSTREQREVGVLDSAFKW